MVTVQDGRAEVVLGDKKVEIRGGSVTHKKDGEIGIICFRKMPRNAGEAMTLKEVIKSFPVQIFFKNTEGLDVVIDMLQKIRAEMEIPDETHR